jgi:hypothetical protein
MARVARTRIRTYQPGRHKNPILSRVGGNLSVTVCGFEFEFVSEDQLRTYLEWFENYGKLHRRQFNVINVVPGWRNDIAKLPAHLFKTQNRRKVVKALRAALAPSEKA